MHVLEISLALACFVYTYEITSKQAYKLLPLKEVISLYKPYHTLDVSHAIERML